MLLHLSDNTVPESKIPVIGFFVNVVRSMCGYRRRFPGHLPLTPAGSVRPGITAHPPASGPGGCY